MRNWILPMLVLAVNSQLPAAEPPPGTAARNPAPKPARAVWAGFVEMNFPFYSSVLDARTLGEDWPVGNLTPRGLILNLGHDCWVCFDTDLLRVSAMWTGQSVTPVSMSQGSYNNPGVKAAQGQVNLPQIAGTPWLANGVYPGWQSGDNLSLDDPREPGPDASEVGRGPLDPTLGRFKAIRLRHEGVVLEYEIAGVSVQERMEARVIEGHPVVQRHFRLERVPKLLHLLLGGRPTAAAGQLAVVLASGSPNSRSTAELTSVAGDPYVVRVLPSDKPVEFRVVMALNHPARTWDVPADGARPALRWPLTLTTRATLSNSRNAFVVDNIALPLDNPWRRNIRLADIAFFPDGRAAAVTFDGDVWLLSGFDGDRISWKRFTSGLHEPLSLAIRDEEIFVYDRNGIWRLRDTDGNGEADVHELFSNAFTQTAETREYATSMKLAPDDSFVIAKGGQQTTKIGKHNGAVLRVSPDGRKADVLGWGLRMPFIGVHPRTGLVTASDQQGSWVPATPLYVIRDRQYYGFVPLIRPKKQYPEQYPAPIAEPLTWVPHSVDASAVGHVWLTGARMGPLNDALIQLDYSRPEMFRVMFNHRAAHKQAAVVSLTRDLAFPLLSGAVNPRDGQLYVAGFQIYDTKAKQISGLARLRHTGAPNTLPREVAAMDKGILLRFDTPLDARRAADPANFSAERWNYRRTISYGSPHFKLDGSKGQEPLVPSSAYLSIDGRRVFIGIPDMRPAMQMRLGWSLAIRDGAAFAQSAYFTPRELTRFDPAAEGFAPLTVDLTPRAVTTLATATPITAEEGRRIAELMGCVACHSVDGTTLAKTGPSWKGLFGSERTLSDGTRAKADKAYLRRAIKDPTAQVVSGFDKSDAGMPSYEGVLTDAQIEALIRHIQALR